MDIQQSVGRFHKATHFPIGFYPSALAPDRLKLRHALIDEEFREYEDACGYDRATEQFTGVQDLVEMADALGDIVIVCFGAALELGIDLNQVIREQMRANMSKLDEDGNPLINECQDEGCPQHGTPHSCDAMVDPTQPYGKVLKASGYRPPDVKSVIDNQSPLDHIYSF